MSRWSVEKPSDHAEWMSRARLPGEEGMIRCPKCGGNGMLDGVAASCDRCGGTGLANPGGGEHGHARQ